MKTVLVENQSSKLYLSDVDPAWLCAVTLRSYSVSDMRPRMLYLGWGSRSLVTERETESLSVKLVF